MYYVCICHRAVESKHAKSTTVLCGSHDVPSSSWLTRYPLPWWRVWMESIAESTSTSISDRGEGRGGELLAGWLALLPVHSTLLHPNYTGSNTSSIFRLPWREFFFAHFPEVPLKWQKNVHPIKEPPLYYTEL